jgi:hypothetical protein
MALTITILNMGSTVWTRNVWEVGAGEENKLNWTDEITSTPSTTLESRGSTQASAESEHMTPIVEDNLWMWVGYTSDAGSFSIALTQQFHMFGIGKQCQWCVPTSDGSFHWTSDTDPVAIQLNGTTVTATPSLSSSDGTISVDIT